MIDCTRFEHELATLAAGDVAPAERDATLARLEAHAAGCAACAGTADLLRVLAEPAGRRDVADEPGAEYWADFDRRLGERLRREQAPPGRGRGGLAWAAAAAVLLVALAAGRIVLRERAPAGAGGEVAQAGQDTAPPPPGEEFPAELAAVVPAADDVDLLLQVDDLAGWGTGWGEEDLFPDVGALDDEQRRALLHWLEEQPS